ncbi:MAG: glycerol-3-phosphate dehydrogenase/oxidase [Bryobacterales bacterium]|nr:glycerol-3-phosphate dehydrogenase/oxidase [Bryobacterales bacterium]
MSGFPPDLRARSLEALRDATVDVLIVGGGINGAGIARELGLRREQAGGTMRVAVVDRSQFGSGTSGKNSQLIHGGLRYLKYLQFSLVKESLHERAVLRRLAPHMVQPLAFLMPIYSRVEKLKILMGLSMYDQLAGDQNISKHREVSKREIASLEPDLEQKGLAGGALFYDCRIHSARFVLENLFEAAANGILMANHVEAEIGERLKDGSHPVRLQDRLSGEAIHCTAKKIVDARGAWSDPPGAKPRLVRGSHLVLPRLTAEEHAIAYFEEDGRIIFFIPWGSERQFTLLGTTDIEHTEGADHPQISAQEVQYLLNVARKLYPKAESFEPVSTFSSLRPLVASSSGSATAASREHHIFNTPDGILRIQGGKYTTYRSMAEEATKLLLKEISPFLNWHSKSAQEPLGGNSEKALARFEYDAPAMAQKYGITRVAMDQLIHDFGLATPDVLAMIPDDDFGPVTRVEYARISYAIEREMALRLHDVMFVSSYLGYERRWTEDSLQPYCYLMGSWLGWDSARQAREIARVLRNVELPVPAET